MKFSSIITESKLFYNNLELISNSLIKAFLLIWNNFCSKIYKGLTLSDIEKLIFIILLIRFIVLSFKYNLKTSFYILCIGIITGLLWYVHLVEILDTYQNVLANYSFLPKHNLSLSESNFSEAENIMDYDGLVNLNQKIRWYNIGQAISDAFKHGTINKDSKTGFRYLIDPISMSIAALPETLKSKILPIYYIIYYEIIPGITRVLSYLWREIGLLAVYISVAKLGRRFCPYLIRWHWTMVILVDLLEDAIIGLAQRIHYFATNYIFIKLIVFEHKNGYPNLNLRLQFNTLEFIYVFIIGIHVSFIILALLYGISGQYFYIPFITENTEIHIGRRSKTDIYSGGNTPWQDIAKKNVMSKICVSWFNIFRIKNSKFKQLVKKFRKFWRKREYSR